MIEEPLKIYHLHFPVIDSTQDYIRREMANVPPGSLYTVTADLQTKGRGRHGRKWNSSEGKNILISFLVDLPQADKGTNLAQVLSYSAMTLLDSLHLHSHFKWPNDIQMNGKKIAGALCEIENVHKAIVGMGLNVNMTEKECEEIDQQATSIFCETSQSHLPIDLALQLAAAFRSHLLTFFEKGMQPFLPYINDRLAYRGEEVTLNTREKQYSGTLLSVEGNGSLVLEIQGKKHPFFEGSIAK